MQADRRGVRSIIRRGTSSVATATGDPAIKMGWAYLAFSAPKAVAANDNLIIGVRHPNGAYGKNENGFTHSPRSSANITSPESTTSEPNAMFECSKTPVFPASSFKRLGVLHRITTSAPTSRRTDIELSSTGTSQSSLVEVMGPIQSPGDAPRTRGPKPSARFNRRRPLGSHTAERIARPWLSVPRGCRFQRRGRRPSRRSNPPSGRLRTGATQALRRDH